MKSELTFEKVLLEGKCLFFNMKMFGTAILAFFLLTCHSQPVSLPNSLSDAANQFLNTLNASDKKKAVVEFGSDAHYDWHYFPKNDRTGIALRDMSERTKTAAMNLLRMSMSDTGVQKAEAIIRLEGILGELEGRPAGNEQRNPGKYYFTIYGTPSDKNIWGWRLEGHHLSLTFSADDNQLVSVTPGFMGTNPAIVLSGPHKGMQVLKDETEIAFALINSLNEEQKKIAVISNFPPGDIVSFVSKRVDLKHEGIPYTDLNEQQKQLMQQLLGIYLRRYTRFSADKMMKEIEKAGMQNLRFAWAGATQPRQPHYYKIHGPTILIEYDNIENNGNHVHSVVRDLQFDFGGDELLRHYKRDH